MRPRAEQFRPHAACTDPNSCHVHRQCMYLKCPGGERETALAALSLEGEMRALEDKHAAAVQRIVELELENEGMRDHIAFLTKEIIDIAAEVDGFPGFLKVIEETPP